MNTLTYIATVTREDGTWSVIKNVTRMGVNETNISLYRRVNEKSVEKICAIYPLSTVVELEEMRPKEAFPKRDIELPYIQSMPYPHQTIIWNDGVCRDHFPQYTKPQCDRSCNLGCINEEMHKRYTLNGTGGVSWVTSAGNFSL